MRGHHCGPGGVQVGGSGHCPTGLLGPTAMRCPFRASGPTPLKEFSWVGSQSFSQSNDVPHDLQSPVRRFDSARRLQHWSSQSASGYLTVV